ncbi:hypothetical protein GGI07_000719 [Coemansia sp. Benny D115]|nr:hypothetical protein GGI07_000719 [Coemansia sp. Benny D115]
MAAETKMETEFEGPLLELKKINSEISVLVEQLVDEEAALHAKYELKKAPLYKKREKVIGGIPKFWLTCLEKHPVITSLIENDDAKAISYLRNIEIQRSAQNPINYKVIFLFDENPYFSNERLIKEFDFSDKGNIKVVNHKINWKPDMDLTAAAKKSDGEADADVDADAEANSDSFSENEDASFFCWFSEANGSDLADLIANDLFPNADMYFVDREDSDDEETPVYELIDSDFDEDAAGVVEGEDEEGDELDDAPATKRIRRE